MGFKVKYQPEQQLPDDSHGDEAEFTFMEGGVLRVVSADTNGKTFYLAPTVWHTVIADKDHSNRPTPGTTQPFRRKG